MKKTLLVLSVCLMLFNFFAYSQREGHHLVNENLQEGKNDITLQSQKDGKLQVVFELHSYDLIKVESENAYVVNASNGSENTIKGVPHLPIFAKSVITPKDRNYKLRVLSSKFIEIQNIDILPSKGEISRSIDPKTVPYIYGTVYQQNGFYPSQIAQVGKAYILRDKRGQSLMVNPIQYNPITKVLRIYTFIVVELEIDNTKALYNVLSNTKNAKIDTKFDRIYESHFLNFSLNKVKYEPLSDSYGNMLIISYADFSDVMQDYIDWKRQKGISVTVVDVATIGNSSAIKNYVRDYYNTNGLTYLLLVGDHDQVPTFGGDSDNEYGYIVGSDHYIDIFVGRFSGETKADIRTQVRRTVHYEKEMSIQDSWLGKGVGIASDEGANPSDEEHLNAIQSKLEAYGYSISRCYQDGGSAQQLSNLLNKGIGLINYTGHGSDYGFASMIYTIDDVNALTNNNKLPFIFDVACVNGNFTSQTCFAEAWMRASNNNEPTGAIAICASTINQSWVPPMTAQREMNDILTESYIHNIKRTYAGIVMNGMFKMNDVHGEFGDGMSDTWTIFGDPSLQIRTKAPQVILANHSNKISSTTTRLTINNIGDDAFVCLSKNYQIITAKKSLNGSVDLIFNKQQKGENLLLTITGFNKIPYIKEITVGDDQNVILANFTADKTNVDCKETIQFTDLSAGEPTDWLWEFEGATPSSSTTQNPKVVYNTEGIFSVSLEVSNATGENKYVINDMIAVKSDTTDGYCKVVPEECSSHEYISKVSFADLEKSSLCDRYSKVTDVEANVLAGERYLLQVTIGRPSNVTDYNEVSAWIDWDKNGVFDLPAEEYVLDVSNGIAGATIEIPQEAKGDQYTMRVRLSFQETPNPCTPSKYGEVEDYTVKVSETDYCIPSSTSYDKYEYIDLVKFAAINNSTSFSDYSDYSTISTDVTSGESYSLEAHITNYDFRDKVNAWFDWNRDGDFLDLNEEYLLLDQKSAVFSKDIMIPDNVSAGNVKMRVRVVYDAIPLPCGATKYGESEDYNINISGRNSIERNSKLENKLIIYPNPIEDICFVSILGSENESLIIKIFDLEGKLVLTETIRSSELNLSFLKRGVYIAKVNDQGTIYTRKIMIK